MRRAPTSLVAASLNVWDRLCTMLLALMFLAAVSAEGHEDVDATIARGRAALDTREYATAAAELMRAARDPRASKAQRFDANLHAGFAHVALGHDVQARLNFLHVLQRQPGYDLPADTPPETSDFFELVRDELMFTTGVGRDGKPSPKPIPPASSPPRWAFLAGGTAIAGGLLMLAAATTTAVVVELVLLDATRPTAQLETMQLLRWINALGFLAGAVPIVAGTGLVVFGLVE